MPPIDQADLFEAERRAEQAKVLLEHPLLIEAWKTIDEQLYEAFCDTSTSDKNSLVHIRLTKSILDGVKRHIENYIVSGEVTKMTFLEQQEDKVI